MKDLHRNGAKTKLEKKVQMADPKNWSFFKKIKKKLLHPHDNQSKVVGYQGWNKTLMIILVSSQKSPTPNILATSVGVPASTQWSHTSMFCDWHPSFGNNGYWLPPFLRALLKTNFQTWLKKKNKQLTKSARSRPEDPK